jgi:pilus assembly protein CpaE
MENSLGTLHPVPAPIMQVVSRPAQQPQSTDSSESLLTPETELWQGGLSVALIGPKQKCRKEVAQALAGSPDVVVREFSAYPERIEALLREGFDMFVIDVDSNPDCALALMEKISSYGYPVIAYSEESDSRMLVRCMRAGAREFLSAPFDASLLAEALVRVSARRTNARARRTKLGELLIFVGAKGGSGVTTIASSFALSLARESGKRVVLIDLALPLGDAALQLGLTAQYSTLDALQNFNRVDSNFLSALLVRHNSGLQVLAAPDKYSPLRTSDEAVDRLLTVCRQDFDYVVVDGGPRPGFSVKSLFENAARIYLVAQATVSDLRNANGMIARFVQSDDPRLEVVLNRFTPRLLAVDEDRVSSSLTRPAKWKIPSHYFIAQRAKHTTLTGAQKDCPISSVIRQMARTACGLPPENMKTSRLKIFG